MSTKKKPDRTPSESPGRESTSAYAARENTETFTFLMSLLPASLPSAKEARCKHDVGAASIHLANGILEQLGSEFYRRRNQPHNREEWTLLMLTAWQEMDQAREITSRLDGEKRRKGESERYDAQLVFHSREAIRAVLCMTHLNICEGIEETRKAGHLKSLDELYAMRETEAARGPGALAALNEWIQTAAETNQCPEQLPSAPGKAPYDGDTALASLRHWLNEGEPEDRALRFIDDEIIANRNDLRFLKKLVQIREDARSQLRATSGRTVIPIPVPELIRRFYLPLCLWECHKDGKKAHSRCEKAATLLNYECPCDSGSFTSVWRRSKQRDFHLVTLSAAI